jgi:hypothetical protein
MGIIFIDNTHALVVGESGSFNAHTLTYNQAMDLFAKWFLVYKDNRETDCYKNRLTAESDERTYLIELGAFSVDDCWLHFFKNSAAFVFDGSGTAFDLGELPMHKAIRLFGKWFNKYQSQNRGNNK